jgi:hypothetical protein
MGLGAMLVGVMLRVGARKFQVIEKAGVKRIDGRFTED